MAFHDTTFPTDIAHGAVGGPKFLTTVVGSEAGFEQRFSHWSVARREFTIQLDSWDKARLDTIIAFFMARQGRLHSFRFRDWSDYYVGMVHVPGTGLVADVPTLQLIGTGDGAETDFQLVKTYFSGGVTVTRTITRPVSGSVGIYLDGVLQNSGVTVNHSTGAVVFSSAPGVGVDVAWSGKFDIPARFGTDMMDFDLTKLANGSWSGLSIVEVRE